MTCIMVIAGTDSSGGAGLTRDTATANTLGVSVAPVVTAVTAQTNAAVRITHLVPAEIVVAQIETAFETRAFQAVKIGMLGSRQIADAVATVLADKSVPVVIDPVLRSSSGTALIDGGLPVGLIDLATLITPNLPEAALLTGQPIATTETQIIAQARALLGGAAHAVLIKGGHGQGPDATDYLVDELSHRSFRTPRLDQGKRGTGCTLASAIACHLALGQSLPRACQMAKASVFAWLSDGQNDAAGYCKPDQTQ